MIWLCVCAAWATFHYKWMCVYMNVYRWRSAASCRRADWGPGQWWMFQGGQLKAYMRVSWSVDTHVLCIYMYIQREVTHVEWHVHVEMVMFHSCSNMYFCAELLVRTLNVYHSWNAPFLLCFLGIVVVALLLDSVTLFDSPSPWSSKQCLLL